MGEITFFHPGGYLKPPQGQPFGKDVANVGLFGALARHGGYQRINVLRQVPVSAAELAPQFFPAGAADQVLATGSLVNTLLPSRSGLLLRGAAALSELAWLRRTEVGDHAYSLVGLIHTTAPPFIRHQIASAALAPTQGWDAVICTSPSVQQAMQAMFEQQAAWLRERFHARCTPQPQLPLLPLGVDAQRQACLGADGQARSALRTRLGLADSDVLVLWVGRLSFYEKAFPQAMLQAVQLASEQTSRRLVFALAGWFPGGEADQKLYQQAAVELAPQLPVVFLNGGNAELLAQAWAAADVFLSLVDNIQETFGLAPLEAMAAGLPVVVSDWDGYRSTVRDGVDGFRIPTLISPACQPGELLAHRHSLEMETYQAYAGAVAQHTAVHIRSAADALARFADAPELMRRCGAAAQQRARQVFDWPVVVPQYQALFEELAERRAQAVRDGVASAGVRIQPSRGDPFADFSGFASATLQPDQVLKMSEGMAATDLDRLLRVELNRAYQGLRESDVEARRLLERLAATGDAGCRVDQLLSEMAPQRRPYGLTTLVWLAKLGLVEWL